MRFLETLYRHRLLAVIPIVIGVLVAGGYQLVQPNSYTATTSLWVDASVPGQSSASTEGVDPSTLEEYAIQELLTTRSFAVAVGTSGPLGAYLASHPNAESTGLAAIPGLDSLFGGSKSSLDDQISNYLPNMVGFVDAGPQVLNIIVTAPDPAVATGTAQALITEYKAQVDAAQTASDQTAVNYYGQQVTQAQASLQQSQEALSTYRANHPNAAAAAAGGAGGTSSVSATSAPTGTENATMTELNQAVSLDTTTYQSLLAEYQQAQLSLANVNSQTGFSVLDAPAASGTVTSSKKKLLEVGGAGLVVGLLVSVLIITALTAMDRTARRAEDIKRTLGLEVAASIRHVPPQTSTLAGSDP
jgi:uncharacterized protein involved in exopolysaccharide biosynthesis